MAVEAHNPTATAPEGELEDHGHSHELSDHQKDILEARDLFWENPADFKHDQVKLFGFEVDSGLRSIIENLWIMGLPTDFSCEGYVELIDPEFPSSSFYSQIVFIRIRDAVRFYGILSEIFGAGTDFGPEGFSLTGLDGDLAGLEAEGYTPDTEEFLSLANARARGEVIFHPDYIDHIREILEGVTTVGDLDAKRSELEFAEDLDDIYEILDVSPEFRELAERTCDCGHEH